MLLVLVMAVAVLLVLSLIGMVKPPWSHALSVIFLSTLLPVLAVAVPLSRWIYEILTSRNPHSTHRWAENISSRPARRPDRVATPDQHRRIDWGEAPHGEGLHGRAEESSLISRWIGEEHCRLVAVLGIGGIGKTALVAQVARDLESQFDFVFWRSLYNGLPLSTFLARCISLVSNHRDTDALREEGIDEQVTTLLRYLSEHRCLLILDNVESILDQGMSVGVCKPGYEGYATLIQRLGQAQHQSCLLLTSREKPRAISSLEAADASIRSLMLTGVGRAAGRAILRDSGLFGPDGAWGRMIESYSGNPLALKLAAEPIQALYGGDVSAFVARGASVIGSVHDLLEQQFHRLSELEQSAMIWLAIEREAIPIDELVERLGGTALRPTILRAIESLRLRSMVEVNAPARVMLQPVILEYVTNRLVEQIAAELSGGTLSTLRQFALVKASANDHVRESQTRMILQPITDRFVGLLGVEAWAGRLKDMVAGLREESRPATGYEGGNLLNLLVRLGTDLRGEDFSGLVVREAYFQGVALPGVDFESAHFSDTVFTDTFAGVLSVVLHPSGDWLAAGTANGEVRLWDLPSARPLRTLTGHSNWIWSVAANSDGSLLASGSQDRTVRIWQVSNGSCVAVLRGHTERVTAVAFSPDGRVLASCGDDDRVRLWELSSGRSIDIAPSDGQSACAVSFSPKGNLLALAGRDQLVHVWDLASGQRRTFAGHQGWVWDVNYSPDGKILASGGEDHLVRIWDVDSGRCTRVLTGHGSRIRTVVFSPDGSLIASAGDDESIRIWQVGEFNCVAALEGHMNRIWSVSFDAEGELLVSGGEDQSVRIWDVARSQCRRTLLGHGDRVYSVSFSADGAILVSGGENHNLRVWDVETGMQTGTLTGHENWIWSVAFSSAGYQLASGGHDHSVRIWDAAETLCRRVLHGHEGRVRCVAFSPDGRLVASGGEDNAVRLWDVESGVCIHVLRGHVNWVRAVAFSSDGATLASCSEDGSVRFWSVSAGTYLHRLPGGQSRIYSIAYSPGGELLATGGEDHLVRLWETGDRRAVDGLTGHRGWVRSVAFSPDGRLLASGGEDQTVRVWSVPDGSCVRELRGHRGWVRSVTFSPDGSIVASGSEDGTTRLWSPDTGAVLQTLRNDRPYEGMNISGVTGLSGTQRLTLMALGAVDYDGPSLDRSSGH